jgi:hypothetical protein
MLRQRVITALIISRRFRRRVAVGAFPLFRLCCLP